MNRIAPAITSLVTLLFLGTTSWADEPKNHDFDVIRDEASVPAYQLPPILVSAEGKLITTPEDWFNVCRPQLMALFGNLIYGVVPQPESPVRTTLEVVRKDPQFMGGKATRKDVRIRFENAKGSAEMQILVFTPNGLDKPAPAFLLHSFAGTKDDGHDAHPDKAGFTRNGLPLGEVYRLLGKKGLASEASPTLGEAVVKSDVGYQNRPGGHSVEMFDWLKFLDFAEYHLKAR